MEKEGKYLIFSEPGRSVKVLSGIGIAVFVAGVLLVQAFVNVSQIESKLLNFMFLLPVFWAAFIYRPLYATVLFGFVPLCFSLFPFPPSFPGIYAWIVLLLQVAVFVLAILYIRQSKSSIKTLERNINECNFKRDESDVTGEEILEAMVRVIDAKDSYTYEHSKRVGYYAKRLAINIGMSAEEAERLNITGMIHDIGKIGLSENILNKRGALDKEEKEQALKHPVIGAHIAKNLNYLKDIIPGIYYHHENYDGSGYPEGLKGEQIPLNARIISIVDAFDAMTSDRSYRKGMPTAKALNIILEDIGTQFDPYLTINFIDLIKNKSIMKQ